MWYKNGKNGVHTKDGKCIAITYGENMAENALLISKAPELLSMLQKVKIYAEEYGMNNELYIEIENLIQESTEL